MSREGGKEPVAIIGVGLRLPGADRLATFGAHLAAGRSLISQVPANRWNAEELLGDPARVTLRFDDAFMKLAADGKL